jgi:hypothetical protein
MQAYVDATDDTGELPLYDADARERTLEAGRFGPTAGAS